MNMTTTTPQRPPCDCGNLNAYWHGDRTGQREYMCAQCWQEKPTASHADAKPIGHQWRGIFLDGPQSDVDDEGEEIPVWTVFVGNDNGDPVGTVYRLHHFKSAELLANRMAEDRNLELIHEAMPD